MSSRHLSLIFIYRPSTKKIIWYQFGPWINQHDPDFIDQKTITVFGNDIIGNSFTRFDHRDEMFIDENKKNHIWKYDFESGETQKLFEKAISKSKNKTYTGGMHYFNGDNFLSNYYADFGITEFYQKDEILGYYVEKDSNNNIILTGRADFIKYETYPNWIEN